MQYADDMLVNILDTGLNSMKANIQNYVDSLVSELHQKDLAINSLKEETAKLNIELKEANIRYLSVSGELDQTRCELVKFMDIIESMKNTILNITPPSQSYDGTDGMDNDNKLGWDEPAVKDILSIIKHSLSGGYFQIVDKALYTLCDSYIKDNKIKRSGYQEFVKIFEEYIDMLSSTRIPYLDGLIYLMGSLKDRDYKELLLVLLCKKAEHIENIIMERAQGENLVKASSLLLSSYFLISFDAGINRFLRRLMDSAEFIKSVCNEKKFCMELLFISMCYGLDELVIEKSFIEEMLGDELPEVECYSIYYDTLNNMISLSQGLKDIEYLKGKMKVIDCSIRDKAYGFIMSVLTKKTDECDAGDRESSQSRASEGNILEEHRNVIAYPDESKGSNAVAAISFIKKGKTVCPHCKARLDLKKVNLAYYTGRNKVAGYCSYELLYCEKCNGYFADQPMVDSIIPSIRPYKLKLATFHNQSLPWNEDSMEENVMA